LSLAPLATTTPLGTSATFTATSRTTGTPRLDQSCWTSKPGNSSPPSTLADFIQVIVATSTDKSGSTIYGNIAATVVVQVDRTSPYAPDPGHPGFGTIVAAKTAVKASAPGTTLRAVTAGTRQFFLYTPEMNLLAETELTTSAHPLISNEYVWFNGHPVAQIDSTGTTSWTFTDHLGTPILQTSALQGVVWRAEYEPFGEIYALRSYDRHQPLRLPGQEAEQLGSGANGVTDRSYNIHRWYRGEWGRYSQGDPVGILPPERFATNLYSYSYANPLTSKDPSFKREHEPVLTVRVSGESVLETQVTIFVQRGVVEAHVLQADGAPISAQLLKLREASPESEASSLFPRVALKGSLVLSTKRPRLYQLYREVQKLTTSVFVDSTLYHPSIVYQIWVTGIQEQKSFKIIDHDPFSNSSSYWGHRRALDKDLTSWLNKLLAELGA